LSSTPFELLPNSQGARPLKIVIVSPYLGAGLFERIRKQYGVFDEIRIVTDSSISIESALECEAALAGRSMRGSTVRVGDGGRLTHAKLYYFEFAQASNAKRRDRFLSWGSANATESGFGANLEAMACIRIDERAHRAIIAYFEALLRGDADVDAVHEKLKSTPPLWLLLPGMRLSDLGAPPSTFDEFLAQGQVLQEWDPPSSFLRFDLKLKEGIPQGPDEKTFSSFGFRRESEPDKLQFHYLDSDESIQRADRSGTQRVKEPRPTWKSRYCVLSQLGFWCSRAAYEGRQASFQSGDPEKRAAAIALLRSMGGEESTAAKRYIKAYLAKVERVAEDLGDPDRYFGRELSVFLAEERDRATMRLKIDIRRANDPVFCENYGGLLQRTPVPRFRGDTNAWDSFCEGWVETVLLERTKRTAEKRGQGAGRRQVAERETSRSLVWRGLKAALDRPNLDEAEASEVLQALREMDAEQLEPLLRYHEADDE
jgi:hypothetical protein